MRNIDNLKTFSSLVMKSKLNSRDEQLAKIRERLRRERKEELYSYRPICKKS